MSHDVTPRQRDLTELVEKDAPNRRPIHRASRKIGAKHEEDVISTDVQAVAKKNIGLNLWDV
jgi:hypothetical protein